MMGTIWIHLPYPPSVNHYFRNVRGRTLISRQGREYRKAVCRLLADRGLAPMQGPVGMLLQAHPPDRRRRDLDNLMKAVWDSLEKGGAYHDDSQVEMCLAIKAEPVRRGKVLVCLWPLTDRPDGSTVAAA